MNLLIKTLIRLGLLREDLDYHLMRASLVVLFLFFGYQKWFDYEAQVLIPYISNGPLLFWMYPGVARWRQSRFEKGLYDPHSQGTPRITGRRRDPGEGRRRWLEARSSVMRLAPSPGGLDASVSATSWVYPHLGQGPHDERHPKCGQRSPSVSPIHWLSASARKGWAATS